MKFELMYMVQLFIAELIGTFFLVFLGCLGCVTRIAPGEEIPLLQIAFGFGFAVMCAVQTFGHLGGGHVNPTVTICAIIVGQTHYLLTPIYFVAQIIGAIFGIGFLKIITPKRFYRTTEIYYAPLNMTYTTPGICCTVLHPEVSAWQGLLLEFVISYTLAIVCAGIWDRRNADKFDSVPIKLGFAIAGLAMAGGHYTGASMNPARTLGPALINNDWRGHWIYWLGPLAGGAAAGGSYRLIFGLPKEVAEE